MPDKPLMINCILEINQSACRDFLCAFDIEELRLYHDHLQQTLEPRGGSSIWARRGDTPAIVTRRPAA